MKFSVLLPTRNGAELLENCIRSVLDQPYENMELIVSNNRSTDRTEEILALFDDDPRLKVLRQPQALPVTENWNAALAAASGDYLLQIGDDDYVLPGYFECLDELLRESGEPDCLTYNGYAYAFPGFAGSEFAQFADPFFELEPSFPREGELPPRLRAEIVRDMFRLEFRIHLSLQTTLVARKAVERLRAGLYKPPFPDFYAMSALLLTAERWILAQAQPIVIGCSSKSFGRTPHSQDQAEGLRYLGISTEFEGQLPGTELINGAYVTMLQVKEDYEVELRGVEVDRAAYVVKQVFSWYLQWRLGWISFREVAARARLLGVSDWLRLLRLAPVRLRDRRLRRRLKVERTQPASEIRPGLEPLPGITDIAKFGQWLASGRPELTHDS